MLMFHRIKIKHSNLKRQFEFALLNKNFEPLYDGMGRR